jgi:hypothetical protein
MNELGRRSILLIAIALSQPTPRIHIQDTTSARDKEMVRVVIVPGNGAGDVTRGNWYSWIRDRIVEFGVPVSLLNMPDPGV